LVLALTSSERHLAPDAASAYHERIWEAIPEGPAPSRAFDMRRRFLLEQARAVDATDGGPARVLDVGCGEALITHELAHAGFRVIGIDVAHEPLRRARARYPDLDLRLVPAYGQWPLRDGAFDLVCAGEVIEHVTDTLGFFSQVRRVLRSGGRLALSTPAHSRLSLLALALSPTTRAFDAHFDPRGDHVRFYSRSSLRHLLADLGFDDIDVRARGRPLLPLAERTLLASARRARFLG
jgi:2-polyprenyl-3-methyl-5-hydroxy-6-metoxy-1,4-benzoquinol methylase